jgi:hypothetical protein
MSRVSSRDVAGGAKIGQNDENANVRGSLAENLLVDYCSVVDVLRIELSTRQRQSLNENELADILLGPPKFSPPKFPPSLGAPPRVQTEERPDIPVGDHEIYEAD